MQAAPTPIPEDEARGFFRRNRVPRTIAGTVITVVLIAAYAFGVITYRSGLTEATPDVLPPAGGVGIVLVPQQIYAEDQEIEAQVLAYPSPELLDSSGLLVGDVEVRVQPAVSGQPLVFPGGAATSPRSVTLPASGLVQAYPFDSYDLATRIQVTLLDGDIARVVPVNADLLFRIPGWSADGASSTTQVDQGSVITADVVRDGSTRSIALLILLLMLILAAIAILVTRSVTRGRMRLELSVASWLTALLFALIPLRAFLPGDPPLGSWIDVLVFFWVELILMLAVAAVATTILMRANDAHHHQGDTQ